MVSMVWDYWSKISSNLHINIMKYRLFSGKPSSTIKYYVDNPLLKNM